MGGENIFTWELDEEQLNLILLRQLQLQLQKLNNHMGQSNEKESRIKNVKDESGAVLSWTCETNKTACEEEMVDNEEEEDS